MRVPAVYLYISLTEHMVRKAELTKTKSMADAIELTKRCYNTMVFEKERIM